MYLKIFIKHKKTLFLVSFFYTKGGDKYEDILRRSYIT